MRNAKIVCTIGPATESLDQMRALVAAGMDVARLNRSHGDYTVHEAVYRNVRQAAAEAGRNVAVLVDLQGPKIRLARFTEGKHDLAVGDVFTITTREVEGTKDICGTTYKGLPGDARIGDPLLIDDGKVKLRVTGVTDTDVTTVVEVGGPVSNNKGINLPGVALRAEALTAKDKEDLIFGLKAGVDMVALSFVRTPQDIDQCREAMREAGRIVPIIAKLEKPEAIARLDAILDKTDGVMVARGDLGVEIPPEEVPAIQKDIIRRSNARGLPVIVATQMLNSMIEHPRPTRAEASDVANAVFDNTDAVMLSGESASGRYPIESVEMMDRIVDAAESAMRQSFPRVGSGEAMKLPAEFPDVTCGVACRAARESGAVLIVAFTLTGTTARLLSRYRPSVPIIAFSPNQEVRRRLSLLWGVMPRVLEPVQDTEEMVRRVEEELLARGLARRGERIVIVFGAPVGQPGRINSLRLHTISM